MDVACFQRSIMVRVDNFLGSQNLFAQARELADALITRFLEEEY